MILPLSNMLNTFLLPPPVTFSDHYITSEDVAPLGWFFDYNIETKWRVFSIAYTTGAIAVQQPGGAVPIGVKQDIFGRRHTNAKLTPRNRRRGAVHVHCGDFSASMACAFSRNRQEHREIHVQF
jgi:hypothetical protein